jgi:hypothetical protein
MRPFGLLVGRYILRPFVGGGSGFKPTELHFNTLLDNKHIYMLFFEPVLTLEYGLVWRILPDLAGKFWWIVRYFAYWRVGANQPIFQFWILVVGHPWAFSHYHMESYEWAT